MNQETFDSIFRSVWSLWPNKDEEMAAKRELNNALSRSPELGKNIEQSVRNYLTFADTTYCKQLGNWIKDANYLTWVKLPGPLFEAYSKSQKFLDVWREKRKPFWPEVENAHRCTKLFCKAYQDKYFEYNYIRAFSVILEWTNKPKFTNITFAWFCDREKATIEKILEGNYQDEEQYYGYANLESTSPDEACRSDDERKETYNILRRLHPDNT